ncbi:class I SAM-dependent methyltransferase [Nitratireductor sp. GCM10026969]|uniref:class I SAM-dependent methyltransferase n=1 Tax=Nitratireductor sp. GCM10026969 TaxID=3252645 RepID=UPI003611E7A0
MTDAERWLQHEQRQQNRIAENRERGTPARLEERMPISLCQYFVLHTEEGAWLGRKYPRIRADGPDGFELSSLLAPDMLLGLFRDMAIGSGTVDFFYTPITRRHAQQIFAHCTAMRSGEIVFPFPALDDRFCELVCPTDYWEGASLDGERLAQEEAHFRQACQALFAARLAPRAAVFDPACSTGDFIAGLARGDPRLRYAGSDISEAMVHQARARHAATEVDFAVADAGSSQGPCCDALVLRFLNAEVVARCEAEQYFRHLSHRVRPGGLIVVFGHTPVVCPVRWLCHELALNIRSALESTPDGRLFQFYVVEMP